MELGCNNSRFDRQFGEISVCSTPLATLQALDFGLRLVVAVLENFGAKI